MAIIKLGALVTQISGKIGGQTLGTSFTGSYIKNSGTPRKSLTNLQRAKMTRMATTAQAWRQLSEAQRQIYRDASPQYPYINRVGETKFYSGFAIFTKLYNNLSDTYDVQYISPLPKFSFNQPQSCDMFEDPPGISLILNGGENFVRYRLFMSRPQSVGVTSSYKNMFYIKSYTNSQIQDEFNVLPDILAVFKIFPAGTKSFWRLDAVHTQSGQSLKNYCNGDITRTL